MRKLSLGDRMKGVMSQELSKPRRAVTVPSSYQGGAISARSLAKRMGGCLLATALMGLSCSQVAAGVVTYVYTDPQGTTLAEADMAGSVTATYDYRPYGGTYTSAGMSTPQNGPGYTGHVNDSDTAFIYMQARYYDPAVGRFLSVDPRAPSAGNAFDFNRFTYVNDNPIRNIDPDGTTCTQSVKGQYNCTMDHNTAGLSTKQIQAANKAYTSAVNRLLSHPDAQTTVSVKGEHFQARASDVAQGLIMANVDTGARSNTARAHTSGGGLDGSSLYKRDYIPQITIFGNAMTSDHRGGTARESVATDLVKTFLHEGLHTLPAEGKMDGIYNSNPGGWNSLHQKAYNEASDRLYDETK